MPDHIYTPGELVKRISTGELATFHHGPIFEEPPQLICKVSSIAKSLDDYTFVFWPASDCRPVVDASKALATETAIVKQYESEVARLNTRIAELEEQLADVRKLCGEAAEFVGTFDNDGEFQKIYWKLRSFHDALAICDNADDFFDNRAAAEGGE